MLQVRGTDEHIPEAWPDLECVDNNICSPAYGGDVFTVSGGGTVTRELELDRGVVVTGTVNDSSSNPVVNARVTLLASNGLVKAFAQTDGGGNYTTSPALPPGDYRIFVTPDYDGFGSDTTPAGLVGQLHDGQDCQRGCSALPTADLSLSNTTTPVTQNFTLNPGFGVSGTVTEDDGVTPLEGASVELISADGRTVAFAYSGTGGVYDTGPVRDTDYFIIVRHPEWLWQVYPNVDCFDKDCVTEVGTPVALGGSAQTLNFSLSEGATVTGTVVRDSDSAPVANSFVAVGNSLQGFRSAGTDVNGEFSVSGLAAGVHYVRADARNTTMPELQATYLGDATCPTNFCDDFGEPLSVPAIGSESAGTIRMPLGGSLSGTITDAATGADLTKLFSARLELWVASGPFEGQLARQPFSGLSDGDYEAQGLKPGAYKAVFATSTHLGLIDTAFGGQPCPRGSCDFSALPTVFVTAGANTSGIDASLPRGPVISGRVIDEASGGAPLPMLVDESGTRIIAFYSTDGRYASFATLDDDGKYRSRTGFPAGSYYASTYTTRNDIPFGGNYIDETYDDLDCQRLKCNLTALATALTVSGSDIPNIGFALRQGGRIAGTVTDADTNSELGGVGIEIYNTAGQQVAVGNTDALGNYEIGGLPAGSYTVRTRNSQGYVDELYDDGNCASFCDPVNGDSVSVTEGSTSAGIDFGLVKSVGISGTVSVDSAVAGNITVEVYGAIGNYITETLSATDGSYEVSGLAPGDLFIRTRNSFDYADALYDGNPCVGDACQVRRGDAITLMSGSTETGVDLDLETGAVISGEVHDRTTPATKLSGVRVQLLDDRGAVAFEQTTGASGVFSFEGLAAGNYHLVTRQTPGYVDQTFGGNPCPSACNGLNGTVVNVSVGGTSSGNTLDLSAGAEISGNVTLGGSPAVGAQVQVYNDSGVPVEQLPTNASGNYQVDTLPDGDFFLRVVGVPGYISELYDDIQCSGFCDVLNGDAVNISGGGSVGSRDFVLAAGGAITGNVAQAGGGSLTGIEVVAFDSAGFVAGSALTDGAGNYLIDGLLGGSYSVRTANVAGFVDEVYGGDSCSPSACLLASGSNVTVSAATTGGIDFSLAAGSSIAGSATDTFGNPLPDGTAVLLDNNGIEVTTTLISDGLWEFNGLADGTYYVLIENNLGLVDELFDGISCPAGACDITGLGTEIVLGGSLSIPAGSRGSASVNGLSVELSRGQAVSGTVTDVISGDPLIDVTVYVFDTSGNLASFGTTDGLGEYVTGGGLPEGTYFAATANGSERGAGEGYVNALYADGQCLLDCDPTQGTSFTVDADGAEGIDFSLGTGTGVRGTITGPEGAAVVQADVLIYDADGFLAGQVRTDSNGDYEIDGLPGGDYFAHTANSQGLADETFGGAACEGVCDPSDSDPITVQTSGFTESIDFSLGVVDRVFRDRFEQNL